MSCPFRRQSEAVGRVETHISEIFLAGKRAYKLKRAVKFPYLDFSTPEVLRHQLAYKVGKLTWERLDTSGEREDTVDRAKALLGL